MNAIEISGLVKKYGDVTALDGLTFNVPKGSAFGFLGPNGAGKTTTTRILVGLAQPNAGRVSILGRDAAAETKLIKRSLGYLPESPALYDWMRAGEYLSFVGEAFGLRGHELRRRVADLLDASGLSDAAKRKIGTFSRGMKQRLGIAQAFVNDPVVLILDEPTSALDPIGRKEVLDLIESLSEKKTVFFSTHILGDVERVCDSVAIIDKGKLIVEGELEELKKTYARPTFLIELDADASSLAERLKSAPWASAVQVEGGTVTVDVSDVRSAQAELASIVGATGLPFRRIELKEIALEDIFIDAVDAGSGEREAALETRGALR